MESAGIKKSFDASLAIAGNMLAIGGHLLKLKKDSPELHTYLFYKHLLNLLGFVHGGLKLWKESTGLDDPKLKNDKPKLARLLEDLQKILGAIDDGIDWDKGSWEVQRVSAIWLLIEVMYKTTESTPTTIESCEKVLFEPLRGLSWNDLGEVYLGLPAVIFVCQTSNGGIMFGESTTDWGPFTAVDAKFAEMRRQRLQDNGLKGLVEKCAVLQQKWSDAKRTFSTFREFPEVKSFVGHDHEQERGRAYRLYSRIGKKSFEECPPCTKCFHLYKWGQQGEAQSKSHFYEAGCCAEDDVHLQLEERKKPTAVKQDEDQRSY